MAFPTVIVSVWSIPRTVLTDTLRIIIDKVLPVTCDNIIMLSAAITGDVTGHTFEWEQISGTPVTWLEDTHQASVTFTQTTVRDDKVFRFTVDKGKLIAKYYEILVTAVPTEILSTSIASSVSNSFTNIASSGITYNVFVPAVGLPGSIEINSTDRALVYNGALTGPDKNSVSLVEIVQLVNGIYSVVKSFTALQNQGIVGLVNGLATDASYKIKTTYLGSVTYSDWFSYASDNLQYINEIAVSDADVLKTSIVNTLSLCTIDELISRTLVTYDLSDTITTSLASVTVPYASIDEVILRTLVSFGIDTSPDASSTLTSSIQQSSAVLSAIVEVIAFQHSSLG